ncbi:adenosylcobinamide-phosphate synthase CbiB [Limnoglobus roseus]|nr:adenosylcobinamide-phosphate synthase CbiB [Limnoglobus roseus]
MTAWPFGDPTVLLAALALDLVLGDPPNRWHPVAAMGKLIQLLWRIAPTRGRVQPFLAGLAVVVFGMVLCVGVGVGISFLRQSWPVVGIAAEVLLLKTTFSVRGLCSAGRQVRSRLKDGDLEAARRLLAWHLVSRDTHALNESQVAAATIESIAENASDSIVAPWLFFLLAGLPGAAAYRFANTADAMLGYRDAAREWLGKCPARFDDLLNLIPARVTACLLIAATPLAGGSIRQGFRIWRRDARLTVSPNAGHPMAAAAGSLGIELEKVGHYRLGKGLHLPAAADVGRAIRLVGIVVGFWAAGMGVWLVVRVVG